ncbi:MAG TPA: prephenate dehydrogenase/arogenate dehydrogenase family protein [Candidatus Marinimicrobia bacterium]|jgi:prephenate dehydrogenase|nr:prephenate dehydrogenase/arogenate dehydrogenase family protein [Candidatus Neomarinimicrobiota bacterium]
MNKVSIIGFGRFGNLLYELLQKGFEVNVFDIDSNNETESVHFVSLEDVLKNDTIFLAVPIRDFEELMKDLSTKIQGNKTVIDVCSVKVYPKNMMVEHLSNEVDIIATHPLFGPDSFQERGSVMMMEKVRDQHDRYDFWKSYFQSQNIIIEEITADQHDMMAAKSQGLTHLIGRVIDDFGTQKTNIDTVGYQALHKLVSQTCNDSWELFEDIQKFNPYTESMITDLNQSFKRIVDSLGK